MRTAIAAARRLHDWALHGNHFGSRKRRRKKEEPLKNPSRAAKFRLQLNARRGRCAPLGIVDKSHCMKRYRFLSALIFLLICGGVHAYDAEDMVVARRGTMPVILTVPHDGAYAIPGVFARSKGVTVRDAGTRELAERTADRLEKQTGKRPYLVVAKFSRKYIDANRPEHEALESPDALPAYRAYHDHVALFVAEALQQFPNGAVLIDVHGQAYEPDTVFRGTKNGATVKALIAKFGKDAIQGESSLTGQLQAKGYRVFPAVQDDDVQENPRFNGGYTVYNYESHAQQSIDAIQLEFGRNLRDNPRFAEDFANAIIGFQQKYLAGSK